MCGSPFFSLRANFYEALGLLLKVLLMKCIKIHTLCFLQLIQYKCCCFLSTNINCFVVYVFLWSESLLHIEKLLSLSKATCMCLARSSIIYCQRHQFHFLIRETHTNALRVNTAVLQHRSHRRQYINCPTEECKQHRLFGFPASLKSDFAIILTMPQWVIIIFRY